MIAYALLCAALTTRSATAQDEGPPSVSEPPVAGKGDEAPQAPEKVSVEPVAQDSQIEARLERILVATKWYRRPDVAVDEGVVFLTGEADTEDHRAWATRVATGTEDVVAVVNQMTVTETKIWDFTPAWSQLHEMARQTVQSLPGLVAGILFVALSVVATVGAARLARRGARRRTGNQLLQEVIARAIAIPVFLLGLYFALRVSGLTRLAATILGGTGLLGLVLGIAFRDIAENFLASILISVQRPFRTNDLVAVADQMGYVQKVTTRGTTLMTLEGNYVQIPNATVYKSVIRNYTANPNIRLDFVIGVPYRTPLEEMQDAVLKVLRTHPAVLEEPEPLVLAEELTTLSVNLHVYFWINGKEHSSVKVRSSVMRLVVSTLQSAGVKLPPAPPAPIPADGTATASVPSRDGKQEKGKTREAISTSSEGGLKSEESEIKAQANRSREPEGGGNLLTRR